MTTDDGPPRRRSVLDRWLEGRNRLARFGSPVAATAMAVAVWQLLVGDSIRLEWTALTGVSVLMLMALGVPLMIAINTSEVRLISEMLDLRGLETRSAARVALLGTAANLLPLPGAAIVRTDAMVALGASPSRSARAVLAVGLTWLAASGAVAAFSPDLRWFERLAAGVVALVLGVVGSATAPSRSLSIWVKVLGIELLSVLVTAGRLWLAMSVVSATPPALGSALVMASASALSSAIGLAPGGLGLRELITGALAASTGVAPAVGVAASALDRIAGIAVHLPALLVVRQRRSRRRASADGDDF